MMFSLPLPASSAASPLHPPAPSAPSLPTPASSACVPPCRRGADSKGRVLRAKGRFPGRKRGAATAMAGVRRGEGGEGETAGSADFCVFPLSGVCLPSHSGTLNVYEAHVHQLMDVISHVAAASVPPVRPRFAMLPSAWTSALSAAAAMQSGGGGGPQGEGGWAGGLLGDEEGGHAWFGGESSGSRDGGAERAVGRGSGEWRSMADVMRDAPVGCCCVVQSTRTAPDTTRLVTYEASHRIRPVAVRRLLPFPVLLCHPLHDRPPAAAAAAGVAGQAAAALYSGQVDAAERHVWEQLKEVAWLSATLSHSASPQPSSMQQQQGQQQQQQIAVRSYSVPPPSAAASLLPAPVLRFGPDAMTGSNRGASRKAQAEIATWRSMKGPFHMSRAGGERGDAAGGARGEGGGGSMDPYWVARETLSKARRQEAFSFAAADMIELEQQHRGVLLAMTCTLDRLLWVRGAIEPHLAKLRAQMAVQRAMES